MTDRLRPVSWAQEQLGHTLECSTRRWLRRHRVRVIRGQLLEAEFYKVWRQSDDGTRDIVRRNLREALS